MNRELPTVQRDSHGEFSGPISISHPVSLVSNDGDNCNCFHVSSSLSIWCREPPFPMPTRKWTLNPDTAKGLISTSDKPQICSAAPTGPEDREAGENKREPAGIKPAQRLIWSPQARSSRRLWVQEVWVERKAPVEVIMGLLRPGISVCPGWSDHQRIHSWPYNDSIAI